MSLSPVTVFLIGLGLISTVYCQTCGITGATDNTIEVQVLNETTPGSTAIWTNPTYNVSRATFVSGPFGKYIKGLRYTTRYEYQTEDIFPTFVQTERSLEIRREVFFFCADGTKVMYTFVIPVEDKNTEEPKFDQAEYSATVSLSDNPTEPTVADIFVTDADIHVKNANVVIRSSNPYVTLFVNPLWDGGEGIPETYKYRTDFFVNRPYMEEGEYRIILTADDGRYSTFAYLNLTITP